MPDHNQYLPLLGVKKHETEVSCSIKADITGFYASDVSVSVTDDALIVDLISKHQPGQSYYLGENETKQTSRLIPLGFGADAKGVMTHYNNGKLEILVQKAQSTSSVQAVNAA